MQRTWASNLQPVGNTTCFTIYGTSCHQMNQQLQTLSIPSHIFAFSECWYMTEVSYVVRNSQSYGRDTTPGELALWEPILTDSAQSQSEDNFFVDAKLWGLKHVLVLWDYFWEAGNFTRVLGPGGCDLHTYMALYVLRILVISFSEILFLNFLIWKKEIILCSLELPNKEIRAGKVSG